MSTAKKPTRSHHAAEQKPHAAPAAAPPADVPAEETVAPVAAPPVVAPVAPPPVEAAPAVIEPVPTEDEPGYIADVVEVEPTAPAEDVPLPGEPVDFDVVGSLKNFGQEVAKIVETLPPNLPPAETTIADHFDCACGPKRNLSMEAGVYRCHGCGTTHHAQTLEGRKAAGK